MGADKDKNRLDLENKEEYARFRLTSKDVFVYDIPSPSPGFIPL